MMNLSRNWWLVVVRGVLAILFGLIALFWPGLTFFLLILMFGVYAIVGAAQPHGDRARDA
jgi:uncharacterized membrane protein HdeD (DUF308 family)